MPSWPDLLVATQITVGCIHFPPFLYLVWCPHNLQLFKAERLFMHALFPLQTPLFQDSIYNFVLTTTKLVFQLVYHSFHGCEFRGGRRGHFFFSFWFITVNKVPATCRLPMNILWLELRQTLWCLGENVSQRLTYLNIWCQVGGTIWGKFSKCGVVVGITSPARTRDRLWEFKDLSHFPFVLLVVWRYKLSSGSCYHACC